ncbi:MAG: hypothetical protein ACI90V_009294, partial [Bacillariaceae sp.]
MMEVRMRSGIKTFRLTALQLWPSYNGHDLGSFFRGAYLPQKTELAPPLDR